MLAHMRKLNLWLALTAILAVAVLFSACGSGAIITDKYAWRLEGGALSEYSGTDGEDSDARNTIRLLLVGRQFDFTPDDNHTVEPGTAYTYQASSDDAFGDADGTMTEIADAMTVEFAITTSDTALDNVTLTGEFSKSGAEDTYHDPSESVTVTWTLSYDEDGEGRELTAQQALTGTNYILD